MHFYSLHSRKMRRLAAAGVALTAGGIGAAAWASAPASAVSAAFSSTVSSTVSSAVIPRCTPGQLAVWVNADSANGAAGSVYFHLDFTNVSRATCHLYGYPGVSAVSGTGAQLGDAASRDPVAPKRYVNIVPGGTAHTILRVVDTGDFSPSACRPVDARRLIVYPPDDTGPRQALYDLSSCGAKGAGYLSVETVQPGP